MPGIAAPPCPALHHPAQTTSAPLAGKVALVTGSSRSIGASIVRRLAADGADVIVNYHRAAAAAERTAHGINERAGGRAYVVRADVSTLKGGRFLLDECVRLVGPPDILVLNASVMGHTPLAETAEGEFDEHVDTNVKGPLFMIQAAAKIMDAGSRIVFVSTALTRASSILPISLLYAMSKGAVEQLVRVLSQDLGARGITVNAIAPGAVDTPLFRAGKSPHMVKWIASLNPQKRVPVPDEVSPIVAFLASDEAGWINGQTIGVNGGFVV
ncbi:hypothetical protein PHLGIDRAFT_29477 [Phlebiopsis gigantea 11061_1 CR5-6]|uniref:Uncharacterized protein n=1 Tax=Phlebiopsis gigantea (strain 11061_1 CR5-6) TaxID=745531 RepID=A0A0C3SC72_PHLG1|nr:hypothetical protein PHLGIDRAFT_29477 [Phlebiopsis gigantea 11061_1 CR5-6]